MSKKNISLGLHFKWHVGLYLFIAWKFVIIFLDSYNLTLSLLSVEEEFCQWETFNATCGEGEVIVMRTARYGRMKLGKCLTTDYFVGCSADVLSHVDTRLAFSYQV